jgi:hypothetical protein
MIAHILIQREDGSVRHTILNPISEFSLTVKDAPGGAEPAVAWVEGAIVSTTDYDGVPAEPGGADRVKPVVDWQRIPPRAEATPDPES